MLAVRLSKDVEDRLDSLAKKTHRSKSYYVRKAVEQMLDDQEDYLLAIQAYEDHLKSGEPSLSLEELKAQLDLDRPSQR